MNTVILSAANVKAAKTAILLHLLETMLSTSIKAISLIHY